MSLPMVGVAEIHRPERSAGFASRNRLEKFMHQRKPQK
jgi:hypothetical protein